jgi:ElaB/YqjD/DUF883 family membrane-anchored ribosome-binding protein
MALDTNNSRSPSIAAEYNVLIGHLSELRKDVSKLASSVGSAVDNDRNTLAENVSGGMSQAAQYVGRQGRYMGRKSHDAEVKFEGAVAGNPFIALAIAAGAGLLIGAILQR